MNKAQAKKIVLSQLASYLRREVIVDGVNAESDIVILEVAQAELIAVFERRSIGVAVPERFDVSPTNG